MARVKFDMDTSLSPDEVVELITDFSEHRPERWPGLDPNQYQVFSVGDTTAEVREGNPPNFWARERYDWSTPAKVRWEVLESSFCKPGSYVEVTVAERPGGGSTLHVDWERNGSNPIASISLALVALTGGAPVKTSFGKGIKKAEALKRSP